MIDQAADTMPIERVSVQNLGPWLRDQIQQEDHSDPEFRVTYEYKMQKKDPNKRSKRSKRSILDVQS